MRARRGEGWTFQRGGVWYIGYFANGKKKRESTGCTKPHRIDKKGAKHPPTEVERLLRSRLSALDAGKWTDPTKSIRFDDLLALVKDDWQSRDRKSSLTSKSGREQAGIRRLRETFGELDVRAINAALIAKYKSDRIDAGASISAVRNELNVLRHGFKLAMDNNEITSCPKFPLLVIPKSTIRKGWFEREQLDALLAELPKPMHAPVKFMYHTGWRSKSEVLTRQWHHVDFLDGEIRLEPGETKNGEPRSFPFTLIPELTAVIEEQRKHTDEVQRRTGQVIPWVFHRNGRRFGRAFWLEWKAACARAGLDGRIPHDFRRTAARNLVKRAGVSEAVAMEVTGHLTRSVFDRYNITAATDLKEAVKKLAVLDASNQRRSKKARRTKQGGGSAPSIHVLDPKRTQRAVG